MNRLYLFICICSLFILSCVQQKEELTKQEEIPDASVELSDEFQEFYAKFHADSIFQLSHIQFPLQTKGADPSGNLTIAKEDWIINKPIDLSEGFFEQQFVPIGDNLLIEYINHTSAPLYMERRFAKLKTEWMLIYYTDLRQYN